MAVEENSEDINMDANTTERLSDASLALHFNAFTGRLEGGYLYSHATNRPLQRGRGMNAKDVLAYLAEHPEVRCNPMKV